MFHYRLMKMRHGLALCLSLLCLCLVSGPVRAADPAPVTIRYAPMKGMTSIGFWFGKTHGFFKEQGINLVLTDVKDPMPALVSGDLDMAEANTSKAITACSRNVPIKLVASLYRTRGAWVLVGGNDIHSIKDLKGKVVGIGTKGSGLDISVRETLLQNGLDPDKDVTLTVNGRHQQAYASLDSGQVDATIIHQPFGTLAEVNGKGHILAKTWQYLPDFHTGVIVASDEFIKDHPEAVRRMLAAYFAINRYVKDPAHHDEFMSWAAEYLHQDRELLEKAMAVTAELWENDPKIYTDKLDATQDMQIKWHMQREKVDASKYVDLRFIPKD